MHLIHILSVPGKPIKNSQKPLNLLDSSTALGLGFPWTATVYSLSVFSLFFPPVVRRFYSIRQRSTLPCPILRQHHDLIGQVDLSDRGDWTGWKVEGDSPHLGLVSWCQDTWEMSLTLVWISWRHSGHVSSCKAHSMQIPLKKWQRSRRWLNCSAQRDVTVINNRFKCPIEGQIIRDAQYHYFIAYAHFFYF